MNHANLQASIGFGLGLRSTRCCEFLAEPEPTGWLDIDSDNDLAPGGKLLHMLNRIRQRLLTDLNNIRISAVNHGLSAIEAAAAGHLRAGLGFAATCESLNAGFPDADIASEAVVLQRRWVEEGLLSAVITPA